ncbi:MAG: hypothetical protein MUD10_00765 [Candidatus Pacebacteria bacterium]|nr:hypothetical protein [Candidatus Paceibacterota bacterium]
MPEAEQMPNMTAAASAQNAEAGPSAKPAAETTVDMPQAQAELGADGAERLSVETAEASEPQKELSPEESLVETQEEIRKIDEELARLTQKNEKADQRCEELGEKLGADGKRTEIAREMPRRKELDETHVLLVRQETVYRRRVERQRETAEQILKKKIGELFQEFGALAPEELESMMVTGRMSDKELFKSHVFGMLDQETAKQMIQAYKEGVEGEEMQKFITRIEITNLVIYKQANEEAVRQMKSEPAAETQTNMVADQGAATERAAENNAAPKSPAAGPSSAQGAEAASA